MAGGPVAVAASAADTTKRISRRTAGGIDRAILVASAAVAVALPALAHWRVAAAIEREAEPALSDALGAAVEIGSVDADLTGQVAIRDLRIGRMVAIERVEAAAGFGGLLAGSPRVDVIRLESPRLRVRVDADGQSDLERLIRRALARRGDGARHAGRARSRGLHRGRVSVSDGALAVEFGSHGAVHVTGLEVHPRAGGARVVAGRVAVDLHTRSHTLRGGFDRAAADLAVIDARADEADAAAVAPGFAINRLLVTGGRLVLSTHGQAPLSLVDASISRGVDPGEGGTAVRAAVEMPGENPTVAVALARAAGRVRISVDGRELPLAPLAPLLPRGLALAHARGTGAAVIERAPGRDHITADAQITGLAVDDRRVSVGALSVSALDAPLAVSVSIGVSGARTPAADDRDPAPHRTVAIESLRLGLGAIALVATGELAYPPGTQLPERGALRADIPRLPCADALAAIPPEASAALRGLTVRGSFAARAELAFDRADPRATELALAIDVDDCRVVREPDSADPRALRGEHSHRLPDGSIAELAAPGQDGPGYASLASLPRFVPDGFVAAEDARFYRHRGFDAHQIERSLAIDLRDAAFVRGGSSITQQLAKNLYLTPHRTLARKLQEAVLAWRLEAHLSKRDILERYLNIIELGPGVFGIARAAEHWFGKPAGALTVREAAFLIALTPAPRTVSRRVATHGGLDPDTTRRVEVVLSAMRRAGAITERQLDAARSGPLALRREAVAALSR